MIKLGTSVTDKITGVKGTAYCRTVYLYDCARVGVQPAAMDDTTKVPDRVYVDELNLIEDDGTPPEKPSILGQQVTDSISGYKGTAVCYTEYIHAVPRVGIQKKGLTKEGKPFDALDVDFPQLKEYEKYKTPALEKKKGGPGDVAPRLSACPR